MYCRKCGEKNSDNAKFCRRCGSAMTDYSGGGENNFNRFRKGRYRGLFAVIAIVFLAVAVAVAVIFGVRGRKARQKQENYEKYLADAGKYLEAMDYERAEDCYLGAIAIEPRKAAPYLELSDLYLDRGRCEDAGKLLHKAEVIFSEEGVVEDSEQDSSELGQEIRNRLDRAENASDFTWTVEPTIDASDIYYLPENDGTVYCQNDFARQHMSPYAVIKRGARFGLIDMEGNSVGDADCTMINRYGAEYFLSYSAPKFSQEQQMEMYGCFMDDDGLSEEVPATEIDIPCDVFYFCDGIHALNISLNDGTIVLPDREPSSTIPIQQSEMEFSGQDPMDFGYGPGYEFIEGLPEKYAIYGERGLVSDFVYDAAGSCSEGLLAVCQSGKWGYVNENGEEVIPIEYDASWKLPEEYTDRPLSISMEFCYAASEGCVVLRKGDQWELRDTSGDRMIPSGIFEEIRPVFEGKCWVKKAGKWGVISLEKVSEESKDFANAESDSADENTFTPPEAIVATPPLNMTDMGAVSVDTFYSEEITPDDTEIYRIICQKEGETEPSIMDIDLSGGSTSGYLPQGDYVVKKIYYLGTNERIIGQSIGIVNTLHSVAGDPRFFTLAIGKERVEGMERRYGPQMVFCEESVEYPEDDSDGINIFYCP